MWYTDEAFLNHVGFPLSLIRSEWVVFSLNRLLS